MVAGANQSKKILSVATFLFGGGNDGVRRERSGGGNSFFPPSPHHVSPRHVPRLPIGKPPLARAVQSCSFSPSDSSISCFIGQKWALGSVTHYIYKTHKDELCGVRGSNVTRILMFFHVMKSQRRESVHHCTASLSDVECGAGDAGRQSRPHL